MSLFGARGRLAAGVAEAPLRRQMPDSPPDTAAWPGDERLTPMMTRRSIVDWVLHRAAAAEPRITVRFGGKVTGLLTAPGRSGGRPPHVTDVRTDRGEVAADLVIDATGRRSPIDDWLAQIGARATATWRAECGIAYFSRHYRVRPGAGLPAPLVRRIVVALDEFLAGKWGGDNGAVQLVVAPLAADRRFRATKDPQVFTAVLRDSPGLRGLAGGDGPDHRRLPDGRTAQHPAPPGGRWHTRGHRPACDRRLGLHHQPDPRPRLGAGPERRRRSRRELVGDVSGCLVHRLVLDR
jgi:hypothetical protein